MPRLDVDGLTAETRPVMPGDLPLLLAFIHDMADFERLTTQATRDSLREALFEEPAAALAELVLADGQPAGYFIYYFTFGSMTGRRGLWLDDLFISAAFRGRGLGRAVMRYLAGVAERRSCARFEWMVLDWNHAAIAFYKSLGADVLDDHRVCRLDAAGLAALAEGPGAHSGR